VLFTRANVQGALPSQVAAGGGYAYYTTGLRDQAGLYRFALTTPPGPIETLSGGTGTDIGLDPTPGDVVSNYTFYATAGVAMGLSGELYVADSARNAVYRVEPDSTGTIDTDSPIVRAFGDGAARFIPEVGAGSYTLCASERVARIQRTCSCGDHNRLGDDSRGANRREGEDA
jgi:hypothetical protein